jgi:hypothetical protein
MWQKRMPIGFWWESQKERKKWDDIDVSGIVILRRIGWDGVYWIDRSSG